MYMQFFSHIFFNFIIEVTGLLNTFYWKLAHYYTVDILCLFFLVIFSISNFIIKYIVTQLQVVKSKKNFNIIR